MDSPKDPTAAAGDAPIDEVIAQAEARERDARQWLRVITPLIQLRSHDADPSDRVQLAFDLLHIAACERAARILRSDLGPDRG